MASSALHGAAASGPTVTRLPHGPSDAGLQLELEVTEFLAGRRPGGSPAITGLSESEIEARRSV